jgi:hypothetical protein
VAGPGLTPALLRRRLRRALLFLHCRSHEPIPNPSPDDLLFLGIFIMPAAPELLSYIDKHEEKFIDRLAEAVAIPSFVPPLASPSLSIILTF